MAYCQVYKTTQGRVNDHLDHGVAGESFFKVTNEPFHEEERDANHASVKNVRAVRGQVFRENGDHKYQAYSQYEAG